MPSRAPPVSLAPSLYESWLAENPKPVVGGIDLEGPSHARFLEARGVDTRVLPGHYAATLMISAASNRFTGLKVKVTLEGFDYLIRGDQTHAGPFRAEGGGHYADGQAHFHELDYYKPPTDDGHPRTRRIVPPGAGLSVGMSQDEFFRSFTSYYHFMPSSGMASATSPRRRHSPDIPNRARQVNLEDAYLRQHKRGDTGAEEGE